ncbi:TetR family transcriptional regulator [Blastococcus colisei]|uniref:TetR family transcriptional regulator n=2 Tax=Blastococcus colisei TaxID=1564162 RepID=A0A543P1U5_9ACTN|nr:TetR family transcriptional regulator [Blastococcus colisei]
MDRRALKKARTRDRVRTVAQRMFAEGDFDSVTIADIAREADVAVQTVFNHFTTKEELFFDGRTPWVAGPADAVRDRMPSMPPLTALREYLVGTVRDLVSSLGQPDRRCYVGTLEASDALRAHERELVHETELRLRSALVDAWSADASPAAPADPETAATLVAASWLSTARTLVVTQRTAMMDDADPAVLADRVLDMADRLFRHFEAGVAVVHGRGQGSTYGDTGWPPVAMRRAG